jgi:hypothetical protein
MSNYDTYNSKTPISSFTTSEYYTNNTRKKNEKRRRRTKKRSEGGRKRRRTETNSSELRSSVLRFPEFPRIPSATRPEYFTRSDKRKRRG